MDLTPKQQLNLLMLYSDQMAHVLSQCSEEDLSVFRGYMSSDVYLKIRDQMKADPVIGATEMWELLLVSSMNKALYSDTLNFLTKVDKQLHGKLSLVHEESERTRFGDILRCAHLILPAVEQNIIQIIGCLFSKDVSEYNPICQAVHYYATLNGDKAAARLLLRLLPTCGIPDVFFDFFDALGQSIDGLEARNKVDPQFDKKYDCFQADKLCNDARVRYVAIDASIEDAILADDDDKRFVVNLRYEHLPSDARVRKQRRRILSECSTCADEELESIDELMEAAPEPAVPIELRLYQEELATFALQGKSTVVCAPTGSGKTIVAVKIIYEHLLEGNRQKEKRKVCFLVPSAVLVTQQEQQISSYLKHKWVVKGLFGTGGGETSVLPKVPTVRSSHVIVITPQLIVNMMKHEDPADRLSLTEFSLIVFDEAHHADEKHPYNEIMRFFHHLQHTQRLREGEKLPQVVGLTASLGAGGNDTNNTDDAVEHVLKMCSNLNVECISRVRVNTNDLQHFSNANSDEIYLLVNNHTLQPFYGIVTALMKQVEEKLIPLLAEHLADEMQSEMGNALSPPQPRHKPSYENWFGVLLQNHVPRLNIIEPDIKLRITAFLLELKMYFTALEYHAHLPPASALNFLLKRNHEIGTNTDATIWLRDVFTENFDDLAQATSTATNGLLEELCNRLSTEFSTKMDARVIVFVKTRELTMELQDVLNERLGPTIKTSRLTSSNTSTDQGGQNAAERAKQLENFRNGDVQILVATTVAEEGLDIALCSLVIKYNHVTNEIAMVQRRGRGRAAGSRSVLLTQEKGIADKEKANQQREQLMLDALIRIDELGTAWFDEQIQQKTEEMRAKRQRELALMEERRALLAGNSYNLLCKSCDALMCRSVDVRVACNSHHVCVDPSIWKRIMQQEYLMPEVFEMMSIEGRAHCFKCNTPWGQIIKFRNVKFPTFKADNLVLQETNNPDKKYTKKQWAMIKETLFEPGEISTRDIAEMQAAAQQLTNPNQFNQFELFNVIGGNVLV